MSKYVRHILQNAGTKEEEPSTIKLCENCGEYPVSKSNYYLCKRCI